MEIVDTVLERSNHTKFNAKRTVGSTLVWRLVYADGKVIDIFESGGYTWTIKGLFAGTERECLGEIRRLKLEVKPIEIEVFEQCEKR